MDTELVRKRYDRHERREAELPGYRREETEETVRLIELAGEWNFLAWSSLGDSDADAVIERELARFRELGQGFEWKLYDHDRPADLKERLRSHGFSIGGDEAIMALDLEELPGRLKASDSRMPGGLEIRRIEDPALLGDAARPQAAVWGEEDSVQVFSTLVRELRDSPTSISVYVAYMAGEPVASAWARFPERSPFASLWGGSVLESHRGRGIYSALLALRAREALRRGYDWLTIDAGPMSRPIVERLGFRLLAISNPCESPKG